jgi:hypothetical protein
MVTRPRVSKEPRAAPRRELADKRAGCSYNRRRQMLAKGDWRRGEAERLAALVQPCGGGDHPDS